MTRTQAARLARARHPHPFHILGFWLLAVPCPLCHTLLHVTPTTGPFTPTTTDLDRAVMAHLAGPDGDGCPRAATGATR